MRCPELWVYSSKDINMGITGAAAAPCTLFILKVNVQCFIRYNQNNGKHTYYVNFNPLFEILPCVLCR